MVKRWNSYEIQLSCIMVLAILAKIQKCESLNLEGLALLEFRERIENDPYGAFANWNPNHSEPCAWLGVQCLNGKVKMLVMSNNSFSGFIPREIGELKLLEVLDLKHNNFSGNIPLEIGGMSSIKCMLETKNMKCCFYDRGNNCCCNESSAIEDSYRRHLVEQSSNNLVVVRTKMDTFSKINHKNFINLLGHCEEDNPFVRMMVFEYAPNGNLYEHLHDHLDWTTRMRIIMGTCYCLEYMHHELNPPVVHPNLQSDTILLTDDYAAKVADISFWADIVSKAKISDDEELEPLHSNPGPTCEDNVYNLGILLLEIISTKSLNAQAIEYLKDKKKYCNLVDPSLKSFKNNELEIICEVIHECLNEDPRRRPTLKDVTSKLQEVIKITPEAASARHSPLWWAELEILSIESG
uniref:Protein kinase domain-containing protein n=1 Tax=Chenopodium quinoa TaxID=63459 RepID=A0A803MYX3_CHEQI